MFKLSRHPMFLMDAASDLAAAQALAAAGGGTNGNGTGANAGKTYTQPELDAMFGARAKQAETAKERELFAALGVTDLAAAQAVLKAAKDTQDAQQTDLQKATKRAEDAEKARAESDKARTDALAQANEVLLRAAVHTAATAQGVDPAELKPLWMLLQADSGLRGSIKPKAEADGEFDGVEDAVKKILKDHPRWLLPAGSSAADINARNRGAGDAVANQEEIVRRKRASGDYSSI